MAQVVNFTCSLCGKPFQTTVEHLGTVIKCPACNSGVQLPSPNTVVVPSASGRKKGEILWGEAGLILVALRLLQLTSLFARDIGDVFWLISSVGIMASLLGLVVCIVALFKKSGRGAAIFGILLWIALALLLLTVR